MMSYEEFAKKVAEDARLQELVERYEADTDSLTDEELSEMVSRYERAQGGLFGDGELLDDDSYADLFMPADDDPIWDESPVDLFGPWWE